MAEKKKRIAIPQPPSPDGWVQQGAAPPRAPGGAALKTLALDIPADLHQRFKLQAVREGRPMVAIVVELLEAYLKEGA